MSHDNISRSVRPFGENYDHLKSMHNSKRFLDAVSEAYKLYQDYLQKVRLLFEMVMITSTCMLFCSPFLCCPFLFDTKFLNGLQENQVELSRREEEPVIPLQKDAARRKPNMDGVAPSTVAQKSDECFPYTSSYSLKHEWLVSILDNLQFSDLENLFKESFYLSCLACLIRIWAIFYFFFMKRQCIR